MPIIDMLIEDARVCSKCGTVTNAPTACPRCSGQLGSLSSWFPGPAITIPPTSKDDLFFIRVATVDDEDHSAQCERSNLWPDGFFEEDIAEGYLKERFATHNLTTLNKIEPFDMFRHYPNLCSLWEVRSFNKENPKGVPVALWAIVKVPGKK